jgi:hypothetical protein
MYKGHLVTIPLRFYRQEKYESKIVEELSQRTDFTLWHAAVDRPFEMALEFAPLLLKGQWRQTQKTTVVTIVTIVP